MNTGPQTRHGTAAPLAAASWVTHPDWAVPARDLTRVPVLRRRFEVTEQPAKAILTLAGLGVWTATLDGLPLTADVLEPGSTEFRRRVAVTEVDVTGRLPPGDHQLLVELGEGPAHVREPAGRYTKFVGVRYAPRLVAQLTMTDRSGVQATVVTDRGWEAALGSTTFTHWYGGEDHDARITDRDWVPALVVESLDSGPELWRRAAPSVRVVDAVPVVSRATLDDGSVVLDFGVNHAGRPVLHIEEAVPAGTQIELWPAENVDVNGRVDQRSTGEPIVDRYTAAGRTDRWHPRFCYHGYRYVELRTEVPETLGSVQLTSERLRSDNRRTGRFTCSDPTLNRIYELTDVAVQSNLFTVLTDCPHREKLGWLEQLHLVFPTLAHYFDVAPQLGDMVTHMADAQTADGLVPDIAPELARFGGGFRDDVNWGSAIAQLPAHLWRTYGDLGPAVAAWPAVLRYLDFLDTRLTDGLLRSGLADWKTLDESTPSALVHGHGYLALLRVMGELADALDEDSRPVRDRLEQARQRLAQEFVHHDGTVGSGSQASYALALDAALVPAPLLGRCREHFLARLRDDDYRFTVGEIGLPPLFRVLGAAGRHDVLLELVSQRRGPGYANMIDSGCTALAETWEVIQGEASANHFMLGYVVTWLTENLAGLRQAPGSVGWRSAVVEPCALDLLEHASVEFDSPAGRYAVAWRREDARVALAVEVPPQGHAELRCPTGFRAADPMAHLGPGRHELDLQRV